VRISRQIFLSVAGALLMGVSGRAGAQALAQDVAGAQRLDGLAALVGGLTPGPQVIAILRSDVELRARVWLSREGSLERALGPIPVGLMRASLQELLGEGLIAVEADRLSLAGPSPEALASERARMIGRGEAGAAISGLLSALAIDERELGAWIERRAIVSGFLQANLEGTLDIAPAELEQLFRTESHPFQQFTFPEARERFAAWLAQQRTQQAVARWVQSLTQRTPHRVFADYGT
jgi:hypothetical protein